jgi:hypothetical protein
MNINPATQNQGLIAWRAITAVGINPPIDIRKHVSFGFTFHVVADILVDADFEIVAAPADPANPCAPLLPQHPIAEVITCVGPWGATPNDESHIIIPAGTLAGSICTATLPCKPDAFIQLEPVSGDTGKIEVVVVLGGPK